jgi:hypothetical protein
MEEIHLHYDDLNKNKCYDLKDIVFQCFGNNPSSSCQFSGTTTKLAIVYKDIYIQCYINSVQYGPGTCYSQDNGWRLYKQYRLVSIPDIPFIVSELKKYERLMMLGKCGISCSETYGVDLIIDILKLLVNNDKKEKEKEIELLKIQIRDKVQVLKKITGLYVLKIESMTSDINDKDKEIETLKNVISISAISEEEEIKNANMKAKLFALKDKEAKEKLQTLYQENQISIEMEKFVEEQLM